MVKKKQPIYYQHGRFFRVIKAIARIIKKKPVIINHNQNLEKKAIFISNHSAASGPLVLSLYFPVLFVPWGAHSMTEGYKARWHYLYHIFYQQKLGYGKVKSFIIATLFAIVSKMLYKGMRLIPTYPDIRAIKTFHRSKEVLNQDAAVLVFPEDSSQGYHDILTKYNPGFVTLARHYYKLTKIDVPIYTVYFNKALNIMVIDKPRYIQPLVKQGYSNGEIAQYFKDITNDMGHQTKQSFKRKST